MPHFRIPALMQHGQGDDHIIGRAKVDGVRKRVQERPPDAAPHDRKLEWPLTNACERPTDFAEEFRPKFGLLVVVPSCGIREIGLGEWSNDEPARHAGSMLAVEALAKPLLNHVPGVAGVRRLLVVLQALVEDVAVPFRNRNGVGAGRDSVPQRL